MSGSAVLHAHPASPFLVLSLPPFLFPITHSPICLLQIPTVCMTGLITSAALQFYLTKSITFTPENWKQTGHLAPALPSIIHFVK